MTVSAGNNDDVNDLDIRFDFNKRISADQNVPHMDPETNYPFRLFVRTLDELGEISPEAFGQQLAQVMTQLDQYNDFVFAGNMTPTDGPEPVYFYMLDKDVVKLAIQECEEGISNGSFFEEENADIRKGCFGDRDDAQQIINTYMFY